MEGSFFLLAERRHFLSGRPCFFLLRQIPVEVQTRKLFLELVQQEKISRDQRVDRLLAGEVRVKVGHVDLISHYGDKVWLNLHNNSFTSLAKIFAQSIS